MLEEQRTYTFLTSRGKKWGEKNNKTKKPRKTTSPKSLPIKKENREETKRWKKVKQITFNNIAQIWPNIWVVTINGVNSVVKHRNCQNC